MPNGTQRESEDNRMNNYTVRCRCVSCGHYEDNSHGFWPCCIGCGKIIDNPQFNDAIITEVGYWQYREKGYKNILYWLFNKPILEKVWVKKEEEDNESQSI